MDTPNEQDPKQATQIATDPKQVPFYPAPIGAPQPVPVAMMPPPAAPEPKQWPKLVGPGIWQYDEHVFIWLDETGNVGGGSASLEDAKLASAHYGDYLNGVGPLRCTLSATGYDQLAQVLADAFDQAAFGKGKQRHANEKPFHEQPMQRTAERRGIGFILGQADKKSEEAQGMLDRGQAGAAEHELLGAIVYLSGAVIHIRNSKS